MMITGTQDIQDKNRDFFGKIYKEFDTDAVGCIGDIALFHSFYNPATEFAYREHYFAALLKGIKGKRVFSLGGGVDKAALYLAAQGNDVISADISAEASRVTALLAEKLHIAGNIRALTLNFEKEAPQGTFDIVIAHDVLHHLDLPAAMRRIGSCLGPQGSLLAMEPVCQPGFLRRIHGRFPVYPDPYLPEIERELSCADLGCVAAAFRKTRFEYFGLFSRESVAGYLYGRGVRKPLVCMGRIDHLLMRALPFLRPLCSYVVIKAEK